MSAAPQPAGPATRTRTALGDLSNKYSQLKDPVRAGKARGAPQPAAACAASALGAHRRAAPAPHRRPRAQVGGKGLPGKSSSASAARGVFDRSSEDAGRSAPKSPVDKVDMPDVHNPQAVIPYLHDIHRHYREAEARPPTSMRAPAPHRTHRLCCARLALSAKLSGPTTP